MAAPTYLPEAVPTTLGWAHPLTGEQLDCTSGLASPVAYYKPNARAGSFIDPEGETEALIFTQHLGFKRVKFAIHTLAPVASVSWDFGDGNTVVGGTKISHVYATSGTMEVVATVTWVDEEEDDLEVEAEVIIAIPAAPVNTVVPAITGSGVVGVQLTCSTGTWTGIPTPTFTYEWFEEAGATDVSIGTGNTLTPGGGLTGDAVYCRVTATNSQGVATAVTVNKSITAS